MDIISFFRNIDGAVYYVMAIINAILIFAIIGYLGEKNNQKILKMGMQMSTSNLNGAINLNPITSDKHSEANIPTVAPTTVNNQQPIDNVNQGIIPNVTSNLNNQPGMFVNNSIPTNVQDNTQQVMQPVNNEIDPNEKVPAVLVINSENTNIPK